jgi:rhamnogalacturonyl hydrolase YesR
MKNLLPFLILLLLLSCQTSKEKNLEKEENDIALSYTYKDRFDKLLEYTLNSKKIPRSIDKDFKKIKTSKSKTWTSGFFAGNLWYIYNLTNDKKYKDKALEWTKIVEKEKLNDEDHDIGFKIYNSFGHAYKNTQNEDYANVIVIAAKTLTNRYNDKIKAIQSWNAKEGKWDYPVIIDNMMNLELLFEATRLTQDSTYYNVAVNHANTTLKNHFRKDHSTYHVVDYNHNGSVKAKKTHQGYSDSSAWARGQAWAVYGYTMAYRYTKNEAYLTQAEQTAKFYLNHENLPQDGIPFWDFDDPDIPQAPKDVSASTIMASGFYELYHFTRNKTYLDYANKVIETLKQPEYLLDKSVNAPFILNRSTGNYNKNSEIDCPIVYADYYLLEALISRNKIENQ